MTFCGDTGSAVSIRCRDKDLKQREVELLRLIVVCGSELSIALVPSPAGAATGARLLLLHKGVAHELT